MKVSVIIPFKNENNYIKDCFQSLEEQTFTDFEVIVVCDHCDEDYYNELINYQASFPIRVCKLQDETGVAAARNCGIEQSTGEYIFFLDSDDYLMENAFERLLEESEGQDIVSSYHKCTWYGRTLFQEQLAELEEDNEELEEESDENEDNEDEQVDNLQIDRFAGFRPIKKAATFTSISVLGILFKREFVIKNKILFNTSYTYFLDTSFLVEALTKTEEKAELREVLYIKRRHNDPINQPALCQISDPSGRIHEGIRVYKEVKELCKNRTDEVEYLIDRKFIIYYLRKIAPYYLRGEDENEKKLIFEEAQPCLLMLRKDAMSVGRRYTRKTIKYAQTGSMEGIAKKIRIHCAKSMFKRIVRKRQQRKRFVYRKFFAKKEIIDNLIVFESFLGRNYSDSPRYVFEYLNKEYGDKYQYVWVLNKKVKLPFKAKQVKRFSYRYFYYMARAKYCVFNGRQPKSFIKREGNVFVETWHGTPLKKLVFDMDEVTSASPLYKKQFYNQERSWDYLVAPNAFTEEVFSHAFMYEGNILRTGYPRNDILHLGGKAQENLVAEIKGELGIPKDKKVILYAPTWRDDEFYEAGQYRFTLQLDLKKMQEKLGDEYVVLLRTHYFIVDALDLTEFKGFAFNGSKYDDIARLYLISDILITDYSSVFFDYANLKRPMLFFMYDLEKYRGVLRGFYINIEEELPGPIVFDTDEVIDSIQNLPKVEKTYKEKYDLFYDKFCGWEDGTSTKKLVEEVFEK